MTAAAVLAVVVVAAFVAGAWFQREIGMGSMLTRLGLRRLALPWQDFTPRTQVLRQLGIPPGSVVFCGDSLVELQEWHEVFPGTPVVNRGVSGAMIGDLSFGPEWDRATAVFCLVGINDLGYGASVEEFGRRYARLLSEVPAGIEFYALSLPAASRFGGQPFDRTRIRQCNDLIKRLSEERGFHYIDIHSVTEKAGTACFLGDGLHFSAAGYAAVSEVLRPIVEREQKRRATR